MYERVHSIGAMIPKEKKTKYWERNLSQYHSVLYLNPPPWIVRGWRKDHSSGVKTSPMNNGTALHM